MKKLNQGVCIAGVMLLISCMLLWQALTIRIQESRMLPLIAFGLCGVSGLLLLLQSLRGKEGGSPAELLFTRREWLLIAMLLACWVLMPRLGFYASIWLLLVGIRVLMANEMTGRKLLGQLAGSLVFTALLYIVFGVLLQMITPSGLIM